MPVKKTMAFYSLLFAAGFLLGIVLLQFSGDRLSDAGGMFSYEWISSFLYLELDRDSFFAYCLQQRLVLGILLFLAGISFLAVPAGGLCCLLLGMLGGMQVSLASSSLGLLGPLVYAASCFPQGLCYVPAFVLYLVSLLRFRAGKRVFLLLLSILFLFTIGIFLESYVNPLVLHKMLKKIY